MFNKAVKITPAGDVAFFVEQSATKVSIYTYSPPVNGSLGAPISITPLLRFDVPAFNGIAFSPDGTSVWLANNSKGALKYAYPTGGLPIQPIKVNDAYDVIVGP
jgi:sugar lactone lactonase YvrE